jgi:hypothetical protein
MNSGVISFRRLPGWLIAGVFILGAAIPSVAQGGPPAGAGPPPDINPRREDLLRQTNEAKLRSLEIESGEAAADQKHIETAIANMKQDFTRIQVLRNNIARDLVAHKPLDYGLIIEQTAEINRRAHRLNIYMLARTPDNKEPNNISVLKSEEIISALVKLCKLIDSFTENPALKNAETIDAKQTAKAKEEKAKADGDLLGIIKLSENIHKATESLRAPK